MRNSSMSVLGTSTHEKKVAPADHRLGMNANKRTPPVEESKDRRQKRYLLQRQAQFLLRKEKHMNRKDEMVSYRIESCQWASRSGAGVQVKKTTQAAKYRGSVSCAFLWH